MKTLGQFLQRENVDRMKEIKRIDDGKPKSKGVTLGMRELPKKDPQQAPKPAWESGKKESIPKMPRKPKEVKPKYNPDAQLSKKYDAKKGKMVSGAETTSTTKTPKKTTSSRVPNTISKKSLITKQSNAKKAAARDSRSKRKAEANQRVDAAVSKAREGAPARLEREQAKKQREERSAAATKRVSDAESKNVRVKGSRLGGAKQTIKGPTTPNTIKKPKPQPKPETKVEPKLEVKPEAKPQPKPKQKKVPITKSQVKAGPTPTPKQDNKNTFGNYIKSASKNALTKAFEVDKTDTKPSEASPVDGGSKFIQRGKR